MITKKESNSNSIIVNPSKYINNKSNTIKKKPKIFNIVIVFIIALGVIGVVLIILNFETDIFKKVDEPNTEPTTATSTATSTMSSVSPEKEVFFVDKLYSENDVKQNFICEANNNSSLATYTQLLEYANKGGKLCKYGWIQNNKESKKTNNDYGIIQGYYPNNPENKEFVENHFLENDFLEDDFDNNKCSSPIDINVPIVGPSIGQGENMGVFCYGVKPDMSDAFKRTQQLEKDARETNRQLETNARKALIEGAKGHVIEYDSSKWSQIRDNDDYTKNTMCDENEDC
jgi:hypothetical protein